ncbi:MAG: flavin reductase family protein [Bryobacteraceae bacterium]
MNGTPLDPNRFRSACCKFPTGVTVTTLRGADGQPHGITVSSFTSVSLDPPLVLVCIDHRSQILKHIAVGHPFGINVLTEGQRDLSARFSRNWGERFAGVAWRPGETGVPLLAGVAATFECHVSEMKPAGDHFIVLGSVIHVSVSDRVAMTHFDGSYRCTTRTQFA